MTTTKTRTDIPKGWTYDEAAKAIVPIAPYAREFIDKYLRLNKFDAKAVVEPRKAIRLTQMAFQQIEKLAERTSKPVVGHDSTVLEAGHALGVQFVLGLLRRNDFVDDELTDEPQDIGVVRGPPEYGPI